MNSLTDSINDSKDSYTITSMTEREGGMVNKGEVETVDRAFIDTMQESSIIRMTDSDNTYGLQLFCYEHCDKLDSERVKQSRGIVFSGDTLVMKAFPYTEEIRRGDLETFVDKINLSECKFYSSYEGMLIRMFNFGDKWFVSTHRKLDAFKSKWSSKVSFGEMFVQCLQKEYEHNDSFTTALQDTPNDSSILERFQKTLDTTKQYMFLLLNNEENRIVCLNDPTGPGMFHVGTFDADGNSVEVDINIIKPVQFPNRYSSLSDVYEHSQTLDYTVCQGIIIFTPNNKQYKVLNSEYEYYFGVRGNEPSIKFRYLQVRNNNEYCKTLRQMYPQMSDSFDTYENYIGSIVKDIFNAYVERFMKKNFTSVSQDEYVIVKACHGWHLQDRKRNIITLKRVYEEVNNAQPSLVNKMIRSRIQKDKKTNSK
jgi:hypothetical protein